MTMKIMWVNGDKHMIAGSGYGGCERFWEVNSRKNKSLLFDEANVHEIIDCKGSTVIHENVLVPSGLMIFLEFFSILICAVLIYFILNKLLNFLIKD